MLRRAIAAILFVGLPLLLSESAALAIPTLLGETADLEFRNYGTFGGFAGSTFYSATVGAGVEFTDVVEPEIVDVGATWITLQEAQLGSVIFGPTEFDEMIFTFTGTSIIQNAVLQPGHGVVNLTQSAVTFGAHSVSIMLADTEWDGTEFVLVNLTLLPEPGTALLFACGLAGLTLRRRQVV